MRIEPPWSPPIAMSTSPSATTTPARSEEHTSELQSQSNLVCRLLLEKKKNKHIQANKESFANLPLQFTHTTSINASCYIIFYFSVTCINVKYMRTLYISHECDHVPHL